MGTNIGAKTGSRNQKEELKIKLTILYSNRTLLPSSRNYLSSYFSLVHYYIILEVTELVKLNRRKTVVRINEKPQLLLAEIN